MTFVHDKKCCHHLGNLHCKREGCHKDQVYESLKLEKYQLGIYVYHF